MLIALLVFSVIAVLASTLITSFISNLTSATATYQGIDQAELSSRTFTEYLRAATSISTAEPDELAFSAYVGMSSTGAPVPEQIEAQLEAFSSTLDVLQIYFNYDPTAPNPFANARLVAAYDVLPPPTGGGIFSYFTYLDGALTPLSPAAATASPSSIEAVGLDLTFLPPPGHGRAGFSAELGTSVDTISILRNGS
jgi:hypothetical protein